MKRKHGYFGIVRLGKEIYDVILRNYYTFEYFKTQYLNKKM